MPLDFTIPATSVDAVTDGQGYASADLVFGSGVFVSEPDGEAVSVTDVWLEKIIDSLDAEETFGKTHPFSRPSWISISLTQLADGGSGEKQYAVRPSILSEGPGPTDEWKRLACGFSVTDGVTEVEGVFWIISPDFTAP